MAQLVDREVPAGPLMLDERLEDGERAGFEPGRRYSSTPASGGVR